MPAVALVALVAACAAAGPADAATGARAGARVAGIAVEPAAVAFVARTGESSRTTVRVTNAGRAPLRLAGEIVPAQAPFRADVDGCHPSAFPAGATCTITITYQPTVAGTASAVLLLREAPATGGPLPASGEVLARVTMRGRPPAAPATGATTSPSATTAVPTTTALPTTAAVAPTTATVLAVTTPTGSAVAPTTAVTNAAAASGRSTTSRWPLLAIGFGAGAALAAAAAVALRRRGPRVAATSVRLVERTRATTVDAESTDTLQLVGAPERGGGADREARP